MHEGGEQRGNERGPTFVVPFIDLPVVRFQELLSFQEPSLKMQGG
jgi:hypothetical protein